MVPVISTKPCMNAVRAIVDGEERYLTALLLAWIAFLPELKFPPRT